MKKSSLISAALILSLLAGVAYAATENVNITDTITMALTGCSTPSPSECKYLTESIALCIQLGTLLQCAGSSGGGGGGTSGNAILSETFHFAVISSSVASRLVSLIENFHFAVALQAAFSNVVRLIETFNLKDAIKSFPQTIQLIFERFNFLDRIGSQLFSHVNISEMFNLSDLQCIIAFNCQLNQINFYNNNGALYVANDNYLDQVLSQMIFPVLVVFAVVVLMRMWGKLNENSLIPFAMFAILMIAWAGQGLIFPQWLSLVVILITGVVLSYQVGKYFFGGRTGTAVESDT